MNTFYGVWSPLSGVLPDVKDLDFAAYYITESGSLPNDDVLYTKDSWLIYICESRGTLSERTYWRTTTGVVVFNPDSHTNVPDSGYYTKIRLDNSGNIVAASDIEYDDLPQELHNKLEAVSDDNLNNLITKQLSSIFQNNALNPIQFKFDEKTGKISASLKLDENSININEFGQLYSSGVLNIDADSESESFGNITVDLSTVTSELDKIKTKISDLENQIIQIKPIEGDGVRISYTKGGFVFSIDIDENSLSFDADGKLCVNPDILSDYINEGGGNCANHKHSAEQIENLEDIIKNVVNNTSIYNTLIKNLSSLVDEQTIIINKDGKLESIATHVQKHQHVMDDITDLNQDIANVWATNQRLHTGNDNQDFNKGAILMSSLTIGEVLIAFNELLKEQSENIEIFGNRVGTIEPIEPGLIDTATFNDVSPKIEAFDVETKSKVDVSVSDTIIKTNDVIYYDGSVIKVFIDDKEVESMNAYDEANRQFGLGDYGNFHITYFGEAYPKFKTFQGYFKGFSFQYTIKDLEEGQHSIYFIQENVNTKTSTKSDVIIFNTKKDFKPRCNINITEQPLPNAYVSGVQAFRGDPQLSFIIQTKNFNKRFCPLIENYVEVLNRTFNLTLKDADNELVTYENILIPIKNYYGKIKIKAFISNWNDYSEFSQETIFINIDNSVEEKYRVVQESGNMIPIDGGTDIFSIYKPSDPLIDKYIGELQVKDSCAVIANIDYNKLRIGPDYSNKSAPQMITLRFNTPKINNFYFDIVDENGNTFDKNKNGTLKDLEIYAGVAPSNVVTRWVDCNSPYEGYGKWETGIIFKALDLFRCNDSRVYATFGKDGFVDEGYLYLKIVSNGKSVNLKKLISSLEECLNERR